ncbi:hypothetical protein GCM10020331_053510 [Ectobacillus funiculus]
MIEIILLFSSGLVHFQNVQPIFGTWMGECLEGGVADRYHANIWRDLDISHDLANGEEYEKN